MRTRNYNIAVVGATGAVGEVLLHTLAQRRFPCKQVYALASERSAGKTVDFGSHKLDVMDLATFDFSDADIALFSAGSAVSAQIAEQVAESRCVVIDNTSYFRNMDHIPLVVPEVNAHVLHQGGMIIANPNCSTAQLVVALHPIAQRAGLRWVNASTYQSVSGAGMRGIEELSDQCTKLLSGIQVKNEKFPKRIAFNAIPHIGDFDSNGYTSEEMKVVWESRKIMELPDLNISCTAVRVPVFYCHAESVQLQTEQPLALEKAVSILKQAPGVAVSDMATDYPTSVEATDQDPVYVGRIRQDISMENGLAMWVVSDNLRKGAALNAVQIAETIIQAPYVDAYPHLL